MMYPYMTLDDETEIVHSQLIEDENGKQKVIVISSVLLKLDLILQDVSCLTIHGRKEKDIQTKR